MKCTGLFAHSMEQMQTTQLHPDYILKRCEACGHTEKLPRSKRNVLFLNTHVQQHKKLAADDNRKELLQPMHTDGSVNDEFTEAYGFNPLDPRTEAVTPNVQKGTA